MSGFLRFTFLLLILLLPATSPDILAQSKDSPSGNKRSQSVQEKKGYLKGVYDEWLYQVGVSDTLRSPFFVVFDSLKNRMMLEVLPKFMRGPGPGVHEREESHYLSQLRRSGAKDNYLSEQQWADAGNISPSAKSRGTSKVKPGTTVYGFHPFWNGNSYYAYDFNMLSRIGYFSFAVDPATGRSKSPFMAHSWRNSPLHLRAHEKECKVDLVVTCYGAPATSRLLGPGGSKAQKKLIDSLVYLLNLRYSDGVDSLFRGDGITLDFQGFSRNNETRQQLTGFVSRLRSALDNCGRTDHLALNLVLPLMDPYRVYDFDSLRTMIDLFIVTGYDYNMGSKSSSGPVSMLTPDTTLTLFSVDHSVNYYLDHGIPRAQTVLCLPWFGKEVKTANEKTGADTRLVVGEDPLQIKPYSLLQNVYGSWNNFAADKSKNGITCAIRNPTGWTQVWAEDTVTLGLKYDYVRKKGIAGTGIWALGYENGRPELWRLLRAKFGDTASTDTPAPVNVDSVIAKNEITIQKQKQYFASVARDILIAPAGLAYPSPLPFDIPKKDFGTIAVFSLLALLAFAIIGFLIALFYESVREVVFSKDYFIYVVALLILLSLLLLLEFWLPSGSFPAVFIVGALAGSVFVALLFRLFRRRGSEGPTP